MQKNKRSTFALVALTVALALSGCSKQSVDFIEREPIEDTVEHVNEENAQLLSKYNTHKENSTLAFTTYGENEASDFEYESVDGKISIKKYIGERDIVVIPSVIDGAPVTKIEERAFEGLAVRAVYIPDSVKNIGFAAFSECTQMSTLRLPFVGDGLDIDFGGYIFGAEEYLENGLNVPGSLKMILLGDSVTHISENAFYGFKSVEAFVLPDTIKKIDSFAFNDCRSLVYINLPKGLQSIEQYAFLNCQSLYILEFPESLQSIGIGALMDCSSLKYLTLSFVGGAKGENNFAGYIFGAERREWNESFVPESLTHITLLGSCESIAASAFEDCKNIYSVDILEGVTGVGISAFEGCEFLNRVSIADTVVSVSDKAFSGCRSLKEVNLSDSSRLEKISMQTFMGCKALTEIKLPASVKKIESSAFYGCTSLKKISANGIESVESSAFRNCNAISEVSGINKSCVTEDGNSTLIAAIK